MVNMIDPLAAFCAEDDPVEKDGFPIQEAPSIPNGVLKHRVPFDVLNTVVVGTVNQSRLAFSQADNHQGYYTKSNE